MYLTWFNTTDTLAAQMAAGATTATLSSGNFGSPTGTQILTVDYLTPSKAAQFKCTVNGSAITAMVRTQGPDVVHSFGAPVSFDLGPDHYGDLGKLAAADPWTTWSPAATGFTGTVNYGASHSQQVGKFAYCRLEIDGTSNATTFTFTLPVAAKRGGRTALISVLDNGTWQSTAGMLSLTAGSATASVFKDSGSTAFTASGSKGLDGSFFYEIA